jgi:2-C-methyl-D-erythritol 4-phosphate cytidylyltransferase
MTTYVGLVVVAAGRGERLGFPEEKALVSLLGHPILAWALGAFEGFPEIVERIVVVPPGRESVFQERVIDPLGLDHTVTVVPGGKRRQDSVALGIEALSEDPHWVMVHDAARPLASQALVRRILDTMEEGESVVPALPVRDSVARRGYDSWLKEYEDRASLLAVQTPQGFHRPVLEYAHKQARESGHTGSDEASLVLRVNHPVAWIEGDAENFKITYPADIGLAEAVLERRGFRADP